jgi:hypothetical protein
MRICLASSFASPGLEKASARTRTALSLAEALSAVIQPSYESGKDEMDMPHVVSFKGHQRALERMSKRSTTDVMADARLTPLCEPGRCSKASTSLASLQLPGLSGGA